MYLLLCPSRGPPGSVPYIAVWVLCAPHIIKWISRIQERLDPSRRVGVGNPLRIVLPHES